MSAIRPSASSIGCRLTLGTSSLVCLPPFRRPANRLAYLVWHNNQFSPRTHSSGFNRKLLSISVLLVFMLRKNTRDIALNWTEREKKLHPLELLWRWLFFFTSATEENFLLWFMSHCLGEFMVSWSQRVRNCRYIKCRYIRLFNVCLVICLAVWGYAYREVGIISWMHGKWTLMGTSRPAPRRSVRGMNKHERCPGCELV